MASTRSKNALAVLRDGGKKVIIIQCISNAEHRRDRKANQRTGKYVAGQPVTSREDHN
ncbi:hypothetical protein BN2476_630117 [Paraburkholderia piptadeniae]|uniref:Uncharacterized protein n=1 Tax=Paraburkholderia piptadeniae TaxID=1701573 RepID=A0A1N7SLT0_9BURK|nr:hypothetical protein BN2476_630117 [Paraburkholderia piptadeniae]